MGVNRAEIRDAAQCEEQFEEIFDDGVITATLAQRFENLFVGDHNIAVGDGELWFDNLCSGSCITPRLQVTATTTRTSRQQRSRGAPGLGRVVLTCRTGDRRLEIAANGRGGERLRGWFSQAGKSSQPNVEIPTGLQTGAGSGACAYDTWSFRDGDSRINVQQVGCFPDSNPPPKGTVAVVEVQEPGKAFRSEYCYKN